VSGTHVAIAAPRDDAAGGAMVATPEFDRRVA